MSRCGQFSKPARIFAEWSLGLGFLRTESRARILLNLQVSVSVFKQGSWSLGFYHSPPVILWRRARLWLELFESTAGRFLSRVSYLSRYVFLRRRRSFPWGKLYACLKKFSCFSCSIWSSLCFWSSMYRFIPFFDRSSTTGFKCRVSVTRHKPHTRLLSRKIAGTKMPLSPLPREAFVTGHCFI